MALNWHQLETIKTRWGGAFKRVKFALAGLLLLGFFTPLAEWALELDFYVSQHRVEMATWNLVDVATSYPRYGLPLILIYAAPLLLSVWTFYCPRFTGLSGLCQLLALLIISCHLSFCGAVASLLPGAYALYAMICCLALMSFWEIW